MTLLKARKRVWRVARYFDAIIAGVEQGKTLKAIARTIPARPDVSELSSYIGKAPDRKARYHAALAIGGRTVKISEETYTRALRALATTNHPHQKLWKEPDLPNLDTMRARARRDPSFAKRLAAALELRRRRIRPNRFTAKDHERALQLAAQYPHKRQTDIDPILIGSHLPTIDAMRARARTVPAFATKFRAFNERRGVIRHTPESYQSALNALRNDPHTACARILPARAGLIPSAAHLQLHLRRDEDFAARYRAVMDERRAIRGRALPSIRRIRPAGVFSISVSADLIAHAEAAIPRWVESLFRDDIRSELVLAVLSGECTVADLAAASRPIIARIAGSRWNAMWSLDDAPNEGTTSFLDMTTADRYTFEDAI